MSALPVAIIIGAAKAATTSLYAYLTRHPEICACVKKEPRYFNPGARDRANVSLYEELWPSYDPNVHKICLEATTTYSQYPQYDGVPEAMRTYGLDPFFFYILRDPVGRIISFRNYAKRKFGTDRGWFDERIIAPSRYHLQLSRFAPVFPLRERLMLVDFDRIRMGPREVFRECLEFLRVRNIELRNFSHKNATRHTWADIAMDRLRLRNALVKVLPGPALRTLSTLRDRLPSAPPVLPTPEERARLVDILRDDMLRLRDDYGVDVEKWGYK